MNRGSERFKYIVWLIAGIALIVIGGIFTASLGDIERRDREVLIKAEALTTSRIRELSHFFKDQVPYLCFLGNRKLAIVQSYHYNPTGFTLALILDAPGEGKTLWLNTNYIAWLDCSPEGRYIAYQGSPKAPGIWVVDVETGKAKLAAPETVDGKAISFLGTGFVDPKHILIQRIDEKMWEQATKIPPAKGSSKGAFPEEYLTKEEGERLNQLFVLYFQGKLNFKQAEEFYHLLDKAQKRMGKEAMEEGKQQNQALQLAFLSQETSILDITNGKEKLLIRGGEIIGLSEDNRWLYIWDRVNNKVLKVKADDPSQKQELPLQYHQGLRIVSEEPLRFGFPYPPLFSLGLFNPPSSYKCYCYEKKNGDFALLKIVECGDEKFPSDSRLSLSPHRLYSLASSDKGLFLKDLRNGEVKKIEDRKTFIRAWSKDESKLAYVVKGRECYEVWLYDVSARKKQRLFP